MGYSYLREVVLSHFNKIRKEQLKYGKQKLETKYKNNSDVTSMKMIRLRWDLRDKIIGKHNDDFHNEYNQRELLDITKIYFDTMDDIQLVPDNTKQNDEAKRDLMENIRQDFSEYFLCSSDQMRALIDLNIWNLDEKPLEERKEAINNYFKYIEALSETGKI